MARRVIGALPLAILASLLGWCAGRYVARGVIYRRDVVTVRHADAALADGRPVVALQLLAEASQAGQERLGRLVVALHTPREWPGLVNAAQAAGPDVCEALASVLGSSPEERLCAAEALAALGDPRGVRALGRALVQPPAGARYPTDLTSVGRPSVKALLNTARYGPADAGERAVALLGSLDAPGVRQALLGLIRDRRFPHRTEALRAACRR